MDDHPQSNNGSKKGSTFHHHSHAASTPSFHHTYPSATSVTDTDESLEHKIDRDGKSFPSHPTSSLSHPPQHVNSPARPTSVAQSLASLHSHLTSLRLAPSDVTSLPSSPSLFDPSTPSIRSDILSLILQYLSDAGLSASYATLSDEAAALSPAASPATLQSLSRYKRLRRSLLDGDYPTAHRLATRLTLPPSTHYAIHLQEYLELIDKAEWQRAYTVLVRRLKPLEAHSHSDSGRGGGSEFADACYLLTCKSVREADSFRDWSLVDSRQRLVARLDQLMAFTGPPLPLAAASTTSATAAVTAASDVLPPPPPPPQPPPHRLVTLLQQAVAYQLSINRYHPLSPPAVSTLLANYSSPAIPNSQLLHINTRLSHGGSGGGRGGGSGGGIKSLCFLGDEGNGLIVGSSNGTLHHYHTTSGTPVPSSSPLPHPHRGRIWDVASDRHGRLVVSASADSTLHCHSLDTAQHATLTGHSGDVYSVSVHSAGEHAGSGGYDGTTRVWDVTRASCVRVWGDGGTSGSVVSTAFTQWGSLLLSANKSRQLLLYDLLSSVCVHQLYVPLASVLSLAVSPCGGYVLLGCQDNSVRLLDLRTLRVVHKYVGVSNMTRSFVRVGWCCHSGGGSGSGSGGGGGGGGGYPMSGSESGEIVLWQRDTAEMVGVLKGHNGAVFDVQWNERQSILASCGEDDTVRTWAFDPNVPFYDQTSNGDDSD